MSINCFQLKKHIKLLFVSLSCFVLLSSHRVFAGEDAHSQGGHSDPHHGDAASSAGLPQLDASTFPSQLFWLAIAFAIMYIIFSNRSLPDISNVIESRQEHIDDDLKSAEQLKTEAEEVQKSYEQGLENARVEASKLIDELQEDIKAKADKQNADFRNKADLDIKDLEKRLNKAQADSMEEMQTIAAELASEAAKKIVGISTDVEEAKTVVKAINNGSSKAKAA